MAAINRARINECGCIAGLYRWFIATGRRRLGAGDVDQIWPEVIPEADFIEDKGFAETSQDRPVN